MNKQVTNLLNLPVIAKDILNLLKNEELIEPGDYKKLEHVVLTKKAKTLIKAEAQSGLSKEQTKQYLDLWPPSQRCTPGSAQRSYLDMCNNLDKDIEAPTFEDILKATKLHLDQSEVPYCGTADNFFYKDKKSRCINRVLQLRSEKTSNIKPVSFSTDM